MNEELISVIVPVYNAEKYLDQCVSSIVKQTHRNLEIILIDDDSPDNCPSICDEWSRKDSRVKVIHKENGGVSAARNSGIRAASGEYICFVDSDDWIEPEMLECLLEAIQYDNADISAVDIIRSEKDCSYSGQKKKSIISYTQKDYMLRFFKINSQETVYYVCNKMFRKSLVDDNIFPVEYSIGEDALALFRMLKKADKINVSNQAEYHYRMLSGATSGFSTKFFCLTDVWNDIAAEAQDTEYSDYAKLNRSRINFTILSELAISGEYRNYPEQVRGYLSELRREKKKLLSSNIAASRKLMIAWFCINYKSAAFLLSKLKIHKQ